MRPAALWVFTLVSAVASAQPCPHDEQVRSPDLEAIARAMRAQSEVKKWLQAPGKGCKLETKPRVVATLEPLSNQCAATLVELERTATECKEVNVMVGGRPPRAFALVAADARGKVGASWTFLNGELPVAETKPIAGTLRVECATALEPADTVAMNAIAKDTSLRFEGCTLRGVPEATVRAELIACLSKSESPAVTLRFFAPDAPEPTCVLSTRQLDGAAVVRTGSLEHLGPFVDSPTHFRGAAAYFELVEGAPKWLCADLGLTAFGACPSPLSIPPAARPGCVPDRTREPVLSRAVQASCPEEHFDFARHDVVLTGKASGLAVERLTLEQGDGVTNEAALATTLEAATTAFGGCAASAAAYSGKLGAIVVGSSGAVAAIDFPTASGDEACASKTVTPQVKAFRGQLRRDARVSIYAFRLRAR